MDRLDVPRRGDSNFVGPFTFIWRKFRQLRNVVRQSGVNAAAVQPEAVNELQERLDRIDHRVEYVEDRKHTTGEGAIAFIGYPVAEVALLRWCHTTGGTIEEAGRETKGQCATRDALGGHRTFATVKNGHRI
jgi:hypothetical protein